MRFALWPNLTQPWADALALARHADATGWDGVYIADHFMGAPAARFHLALAHVVEQRGQPHDPVGLPVAHRGDVVDDRDHMGEHVLVPVDRTLFEPHRRQLGGRTRRSSRCRRGTTDRAMDR